MEGHNAAIVDTSNNVFHLIRLKLLPRVGELIKLWSYVDQKAGNQDWHYYEVVQIVHEFHDHTEKFPQNEAVDVRIFVKPSNSSYFKS